MWAAASRPLPLGTTSRSNSDNWQGRAVSLPRLPLSGGVTVLGRAAPRDVALGATSDSDWRPTGVRVDDALRLDAERPAKADAIGAASAEVAELRAALTEMEAKLAVASKDAAHAKQKAAMETASLEDELARVRGELIASDGSATRARLAAMVYKLSAALGEQLEPSALVATSGFAHIVAATAADGHEVIVKFSSGDDNMALLRRESDNFAALNDLPGSDAHVVRLLHPYTEVSVSLGGGEPASVAGAIVLEKGDWNLGGFVRSRLADARPASLAAVGASLAAWEESIAWLHSHGVLHLDIKADNAILFESSGAVKLIDVAGMLTREEASGEDSASMDSADLSWDTADLEDMGITYVSTITYRAPLDLGPARRFLDYSADWWSMGVSKLEVLGALPAAFIDGEQTTRVVLKAMQSSELEEALRARMAAVLMEPDPSCEAVSVWLDSVMQNLRGHAAKVEYVKKAPTEKKPARKSRFSKVSMD